MSREDLLKAGRMQAAAMLLVYHQAVNAMLIELTEALPPHSAYGREPYRAVVRHFAERVRILTKGWSRS
jgi:hypothetical protein